MSYNGVPMSAYNYYDDNGYTIPMINYPVNVFTYTPKSDFGSSLVNNDLQRYSTSNGQGNYIDGSTPINRPTVWDLFFQLVYGPTSDTLQEQYSVDINLERLDGYTDEYFDGTNISTILGGYTESFVDYLVATGQSQSFQLSTCINWKLTGSATSSYNKQYLGRDENFIYSRNFRYPMMSPGWGASDDYILLNEGNVINLAFFDDRSFYQKTGAGFYIPPFVIEEASKNDIFHMEFGLQTIEGNNGGLQLVDILDLNSGDVDIQPIFNLTDNTNINYIPTVVNNKLVVDFSNSYFEVGKDYAIIVPSNQWGDSGCPTAPAMCTVQVR